MARLIGLLFTVGILVLAALTSIAVAGAEDGHPAKGPRALLPEVWTLEAEPIEIGDAELRGAINPRGVPTQFHFEYGLTKSYGLETTNPGELAGREDKRYKVGATIFELRPGGLTYHFRLVASNRNGTTYGEDRTFVSAKSRPKPETLIACYHEKARRYTALIHPRRCILRGRRGNRVIKIQVKGMRWGHWGVHRTRASYGVNLRNGERVQVAAFRRVTCADGSTWYSNVNGLFYNQRRFFVLRLPTCDAQAGSTLVNRRSGNSRKRSTSFWR